MNTDITDFSCRKSGEITANKSLYEEALNTADKDLYNFQESRKLKKAGKLLWEKTTNPDDFLDADAIIRRNARKFTEKTNPVKELLTRTRIQETLKYGSTKEDLEEEVRNSLGIELLQLLQTHGVTGRAVKEIFDIFLDMVGEEPDVDELIANWDGEDTAEAVEDSAGTESGEEETGDEGSEEMQESVSRRRPNNLNEMVQELRKRMVERKIKRNLKESTFIDADDEIPIPTEAQLRAIVRKFPYLVAPEFGGMVAGETRVVRGETMTATKDGTMTPEEVYYKQYNNKKALKDPSMKTYETLAGKYGYDLNQSDTYRGYQL